MPNYVIFNSEQRNSCNDYLKKPNKKSKLLIYRKPIDI